MKLAAATSLAAAAFLLMTVVPAGAQPKPAPTGGATAGPTVTGQSTTSAVEPPLAPPGPRPLFKAGDVNVGIWAPVQPPYSVDNNRNQAANPIWTEEGSTRPRF